MRSDRLSTLCVLVLLLLVLAVTPALAAPKWVDEEKGTGNEEAGGYSFVVADVVPGSGGQIVPVGGRVPLAWIPYPALATDPLTGGPCLATQAFVIYNESERAAAESLANNITVDIAIYLFPAPPPCSGLHIDPGAPAREAAAMVADDLEAAVPYVQPDNRAITGIRSFLRTGIDAAFTRPVEVELFGRTWDVTVDVEGVHTVDWGDGTVHTEVVADGGPWHPGEPGPDDITHHYLETGDFPVVVSTDWLVTATLDATGAQATATAATTSDPVAVDVIEVRSRRER